MPDSLGSPGLQPTRLLCPWDFTSKYTGGGCHFFLQRIFPDPGIKPRSLALQADSLPTEIQGKPSEDVGRFLSPVFFIKVVFCPSKLYQNMKKPFLRLQLSGRKDKCVHLCMLVTQPCLTVCNPMDCSSIHGILSRQESWSGVPFPSPGDLPNPGTKPASPVAASLAGRFWATWESQCRDMYLLIKLAYFQLIQKSLDLFPKDPDIHLAHVQTFTYLMGGKKISVQSDL